VADMSAWGSCKTAITCGLPDEADHRAALHNLQSPGAPAD